jgi:hypothetical protein
MGLKKLIRGAVMGLKNDFRDSMRCTYSAEKRSDIIAINEFETEIDLTEEKHTIRDEK